MSELEPKTKDASIQQERERAITMYEAFMRIQRANSILFTSLATAYGGVSGLYFTQDNPLPATIFALGAGVFLTGSGKTELDRRKMRQEIEVLKKEVSHFPSIIENSAS